MVIDFGTCEGGERNISMLYRNGAKMIQKFLPGMGGSDLTVSSTFDGVQGELGVVVGQRVKADHDHLPEECLREEIPLSLPLPIVVEDLEGVDLILQLLWQLVI